MTIETREESDKRAAAIYARVAQQVMDAWKASDISPDENGYTLADARVLLSSEQIFDVVRRVARSRRTYRPWHKETYYAKYLMDEGRLVVSPNDNGFIQTALATIHESLRKGELIATGFVSSDPTKRVKIAADSWSALTPIPECSEARTNAFAYLGVRVRQAVQPTTKRRPAVGTGTIKKWLEDRMPEWRRTRLPGRDEVIELAQAPNALGPGASQTVIRKAFADLTKRGRGRPRKNGENNRAE